MRFSRKLIPVTAVALAAVLVGCVSSAGDSTAAEVEDGPMIMAPVIYDLRAVDNTGSEVIRSCNREPGSGVLLSFDDNGTPEQVNAILDALRKHNVQAAFFPTGDWVLKNLDLVKVMHKDGHIVGSHTQTHARLGELSVSSPDDFYSEVYPLEGVSNTDPILLRPPYEDGAYDELVRERLTEKNVQVCTWTADAYDWSGDTVDRMMQRLIVGDEFSPVPLTHDGVVLLHMSSKHAADMVGAIATHMESVGVAMAPLPG